MIGSSTAELFNRILYAKSRAAASFFSSLIYCGQTEEARRTGDCEPYGRGRKVQSRSPPQEQVLLAAAELLNNE